MRNQNYLERWALLREDACLEADPAPAAGSAALQVDLDKSLRKARDANQVSSGVRTPGEVPGSRSPLR